MPFCSSCPFPFFSSTSIGQRNFHMSNNLSDRVQGAFSGKVLWQSAGPIRLLAAAEPPQNGDRSRQGTDGTPPTDPKAYRLQHCRSEPSPKHRHSQPADVKDTTRRDLNSQMQASCRTMTPQEKGNSTCRWPRKTPTGNPPAETLPAGPQNQPEPCHTTLPLSTRSDRLLLM